MNNMSNDVLRSVYNHPQFSDKDMTQLFSKHECIAIAKGDFILREGQVLNAYYIIDKGLIRNFLYDFEGNEITTDFTGNGELAIEVASIFQRIPTKEYMQALTDCEVWKINFDVFQELFHSIPALAEWGRAWMAFQLYLSKKRATDMITETATKRYKNLMKEKPQVVQQAPLKYIASYLGITDSSLSRIRKEILTQ